MGIDKLVYLSNGFQIENPKFSTPKKVRCTLNSQKRLVKPNAKGSKNLKKAAKPVGLFHQKISDKCQASLWEIANKIVSCKIDGIVGKNFNISGMMRRCRTKVSKQTGRFLQNEPSKKKGLNSSIIADGGWAKLILKINYLAAKHGKTVIIVIPKHSSRKCRNCDCSEYEYHEYADLAAAKTIRDRALELVRGNSVKFSVVKR
jgi:putative transposase